MSKKKILVYCPKCDSITEHKKYFSAPMTPPKLKCKTCGNKNWRK